VNGAPGSGPPGVDPQIVAAVRDALLRSSTSPDDAAVAAVVRDSGWVLGAGGLAATADAVRAEVSGAGALQVLLDDPLVTDVLVNGPSQVWVERSGRLERADVALGDVQAVRRLAVRLAAIGGARLDDARPCVDARLPDGTRLHAVLPPVADGCAVIALRVLRARGWTLSGLVAAGAMDAPLATVLSDLVAARCSVLVSGATGTGKTTLLGALIAQVAADERVICLEESRELNVDHPHVVHLQVRHPNVDGAGAVDLAMLVRQAMRMRPDRIVVGECRGPEVREMLTALNTGHPGMATVHANTPGDVPARLEALAAIAGMPADAVVGHTTAAVDAIVHLVRRDGRRVVAELAVVDRDPTRHAVRVTPAVIRGDDGAYRAAEGWPMLCRRMGARGG